MPKLTVLEATNEQLTALETAHPQGLTMFQILECLAQRGIHVSEAAFRKYVQLGLLPQSQRIGRGRGRHTGSHGLYPTTAIRYLLEIRARLSAGETVAEIQQDMRAAIAQDELGTRLAQILRGLQEDVAQRSDLDPRIRLAHRRELAALQAQARALLAQLARIGSVLRHTRRVQARG